MLPPTDCNRYYNHLKSIRMLQLSINCLPSGGLILRHAPVCLFAWQRLHLLLIGGPGSSTCSPSVQIRKCARHLTLRRRVSAIGKADLLVWVSSSSIPSSSPWLSSLLAPGLWFPARTLMNTWRQSVSLFIVVVSDDLDFNWRHFCTF